MAAVLPLLAGWARAASPGSGAPAPPEPQAAPVVQPAEGSLEIRLPDTSGWAAALDAEEYRARARAHARILRELEDYVDRFRNDLPRALERLEERMGALIRQAPSLEAARRLELLLEAARRTADERYGRAYACRCRAQCRNGRSHEFEQVPLLQGPSGGCLAPDENSLHVCNRICMAQDSEVSGCSCRMAYPGN